MKMKKAVRMPLRRPPQRPCPAAAPLRARAATVDEAYDEEEDYGGEEEPNMKFSHALFVVLVLHIIAVGGVFALQLDEGEADRGSACRQSPGRGKDRRARARAENRSARQAGTGDEECRPRRMDREDPRHPGRRHAHAHRGHV